MLQMPIRIALTITIIFLIYINHNPACGRAQSGREMHETLLQISGDTPSRRTKVIRDNRIEAQSAERELVAETGGLSLQFLVLQLCRIVFA